MKALADKVLILGVDALDPRLTAKLMSEGKMPNLKKFLERGAAQKDFELIGGQPTVTPPMWTTLATGANPSTHGITDYYAKGELDEAVYNFDSTRCKAEPLWNVAAEAGRKTLVWHWPGSSWPPTSDNPNLHVVDGTQPTGPNIGVGEIEGEKLVIASAETSEVLFRSKAATDSKLPCYITGMELEADVDSLYDRVHSPIVKTITITPQELHQNFTELPMDVVYSPIKDASGWATTPPAGAKEFTILFSKGLIRRPCQMLKGESGAYDTVHVFKNKKETAPLAVLPKNVYVADIIDEALKGEERLEVNRNMRVLDIAADGSTLRMWISAAMDFHNDALWHPREIYRDVCENVGYPPPASIAGGFDERFIADCCRASWDRSVEWNSAAIKHLIRTKGYEMVFSHFHSVDHQGHLLVAFMKKGGKLAPATICRLFDEVYEQADRYIGEFLPLLDEGWTILICSDHGQVCPEYEVTDLGGGLNAINAVIFQELGYTALLKDEAGNDTHAIDWSKTTAVMQRMNHIYVNLKGRDPHGIVDPADKFGLEEKIITDLYALRDPETGHRVCHLALRNRDAVLLGMGGPESGDIIYYVAEGYNRDHADCLSTIDGACHTSCRSVFCAAGKGVKRGLLTDRVVRHVDVTPTAAVLAGLKMPAQCEGAPVYQILDY
ncbi:MAG: alkaline phosphatase family protein [Gracilibacteraceae bacterium]|jgi:predicted AlkP superfamily phosphohydrolase/phosphomutase|nr:alkaline phosphatase family protein [Gracilibacteraceae bacterium]